VVQAKVLFKSWDLDETQLTFAFMLKDMEKKKEMGTYCTVSHSQLPKREPGKHFNIT